VFVFVDLVFFVVVFFQYEVWSRPEYIDQVNFALDYGVEVIDFYEDYFKVPFPLPKQCKCQNTRNLYMNLPPFF
jgi:aminopeptidase N